MASCGELPGDPMHHANPVAASLPNGETVCAASWLRVFQGVQVQVHPDISGRVQFTHAYLLKAQLFNLLGSRGYVSVKG